MFEKIKAALAIRSFWNHATTHPNDMTLKPGVTTTEFWILIGSNLLLTIMAFFNQFDGELASLISAFFTAGYAFVRSGFKMKLGLTRKDGIGTSEMWMVLVTGILQLGLAALEKLDGQWAALATSALAAVYAMLRKSLKAKDVNAQAAGQG